MPGWWHNSQVIIIVLNMYYGGEPYPWDTWQKKLCRSGCENVTLPLHVCFIFLINLKDVIRSDAVKSEVNLVSFILEGQIFPWRERH